LNTQQQKRNCAGRADPFGLLVVVVAFALFITIGVQVTVAWRGEAAQVSRLACSAPCVTSGLSY
jgi:hypothetical protein